MTEEKKKSLWDEIRRVTDELEVAISSAGDSVRTEAKEKWVALQPRIKQIEEKMSVKTAEASAWVSEEMSNVGAEVKRLRDDVVSRFKKKDGPNDAPASDAAPAADSTKKND
jgi:hypothetical protein